MVTLLFLNKHYDFHISYHDFSHFFHNKQQSLVSSQHTEITGSNINAATQTDQKGPQWKNVFKAF